MPTHDDTDINSQSADEQVPFEDIDHIVSDLEVQAGTEQKRARTAQNLLIGLLVVVIVLFLVFERLVLPLQAELADRQRASDRQSTIDQLGQSQTDTKKAYRSALADLIRTRRKYADQIAEIIDLYEDNGLKIYNAASSFSEKFFQFRRR